MRRGPARSGPARGPRWRRGTPSPAPAGSPRRSRVGRTRPGCPGCGSPAHGWAAGRSGGWSRPRRRAPRRGSGPGPGSASSRRPPAPPSPRAPPAAPPSWRKSSKQGRMWDAMTTPTTPPTLRSRNWFAPKNLDGRPVIGICNSWSELNNCNAHLRQVAEAVKRGVWSSGGFPLEFPVISLGEILMKPTTMLFRNLMAMDVEECIRAYPLDSVVLLAACDKTTPAMLMGAASADVPAIMVTGGPMLKGMWCNQELGSGTDARKIWAQRRAGEITDEVMAEVEGCLSRSSGHCMVMGTASTMAAMAEVLGLALPGNAAIPGPDSRRLALAEMSGRRAVEMALARGPKPSEILTAAAFDNAIRADMALGGSTNAMVHLVALAGRAEVPLPLRRFDELSRSTPLLANVRPSGKYLMEDFYYAGGVPAVLREMLPMLHAETLTVTGRTLGENVAGAPCHDTDVIRPLSLPLQPEGGTVILTGNLCPGGAVLKQSAASRHLMIHRGRAVVFEDHLDLERRVPERRLTLRVADEELAGRRAAWKPRPDGVTSGYLRMFLDHVLQADEGVDFDFLRGRRPVTDEETAHGSRLA